jgi:hypothetical protein
VVEKACSTSAEAVRATRADKIARADVDGHEGNRPSVLLQECDRFGELCPSIRVLVLVESRRATAEHDVRVLTPVEHRITGNVGSAADPDDDSAIAAIERQKFDVGIRAGSCASNARPLASSTKSVTAR